jgi:hypothetical protein
MESVITCQDVPASQDTFTPSAVATYTVSPRSTMPLGATYWYSGPSWRNVQLVHVRPWSSDFPQPLPSVPYQTRPEGSNANACTKPHEMLVPVVSFTIRRHSAAPRSSTKIPSP